jgi:hypothetical protein
LRRSFIEPAMKNPICVRLLFALSVFAVIAGSARLAFAQDTTAPLPVPLPPAVSTYASHGIVEIEGGVTVNYVHQDEVSNTRVTLNPAVRYFIMDGLSVGLGLQFQIIESGPKTYGFLPQAEYNVNMGRLFPYIGVGVGVQYAKENGASSTDFLIDPGAGIKVTFGGGLIGLGLAIPIAFSDPARVGVDLLTRYAIFF